MAVTGPTYRMPVMKLGTDIVTGIAVSLIGQVVILYVKTFNTDVIFCIGNIIMCLTSL